MIGFWQASRRTNILGPVSIHQRQKQLAWLGTNQRIFKTKDRISARIRKANTLGTMSKHQQQEHIA